MKTDLRSGPIKQRILTAAIALPLLIILVIYASPALFSGVVCVLCALALHEFYAMGLPAARHGEAGLAVAVGTLLTALVLFRAPLTMLSGVTTLLMIGLMIVFLFRHQDIASVGRDVAVVTLGLIYVPLLLMHVGLLRELPSGRLWVFLVLVLVMVSDSAAYFVGRSLGRRKLYERISPKKTVEGALGGLAGGILGLLLYKYLAFPALSLMDVVLLGLCVGGFSQVGDLFESMLKRSFGVKDSGTLIPGHGGLLDRLDSLLFAFPLTYYYVIWFYGG